MRHLLDVLPILGSFIMIILILFFAWYATRWYARRMGPSIAGRTIRIVDRASLNNTSSLVIANVCGKYYLLGTSDHSVTLLCELPDFEEPAEQAGTSPSFQKLFDHMLKKNGQNDKNNSKDDGGPQ